MNRKELFSFFKRQTIVIYISLFVVILGTITISSAIYTKTSTSTKNEVVTTGNFVIDFSGMGSTITGTIYAAKESDTAKHKNYSFTIKNTGNISSSYSVSITKDSSNTVDTQYIKYKLDSTGSFKSLTSNDSTWNIGTYTLSGGASKTHNLTVYLDNSVPDAQMKKTLKLNIAIKAEPMDPSSTNGLQIAYSGKEEIYTVPYTGTYTITAAGAEGTVGNQTDNANVTGGKGAVISSDFDLKAGDVLHIVVGGQGNNTNVQETSDGTSGSGGGGTFIFKEIPAVIDPSSQFEKDNQAYEVLLVGAGGSGTGDLSNDGLNQVSGVDGNSVNYKSPSNYTKSINNNGVLGINQYVKYDLKGTTFTQSQSKCTGGFGGGSCSDDNRGYGGGWSGSDFVAYSWSKGVNTIANSEVTNYGNGYVNLKLK